MAAPQHPGPHPLYIPSFPHLNPPPCPFLTSTPSAFWLAMLASTRQSAAKVTVHAVSASRLRSGSLKGPVSPAGEQVPQPPSVFFLLIPGPPSFPLLLLAAFPPWIAALSLDLQLLWWTDQDAFNEAFTVFLQQQAISGGAACAAPAAAPVPPVRAAPVAAPVPPVPAAPVAVTAAPVPPVPAASVAPPVAPVRAAKCKGACVPPFVFFLTRCSCTPSSSFPWPARWGV
jgi:hypothetical protein